MKEDIKHHDTLYRELEGQYGRDSYSFWSKEQKAEYYLRAAYQQGGGPEAFMKALAVVLEEAGFLDPERYNNAVEWIKARRAVTGESFYDAKQEFDRRKAAGLLVLDKAADVRHTETTTTATR